MNTQSGIALVICGLISTAALSAEDNVPLADYYEQEAPSVQRPLTGQRPEGRASIRKEFRVEAGRAGTASGGETQSIAVTAESRNAGEAVTPLPANMERGVKDLEAGMDDLRQYTGAMTAHIRRNGIRGFLAVPSDIKDQGRAVGRTLGAGISGITQDVAQDMITSGSSD